MIKISKNDYNSLMARLFYKENELLKEKKISKELSLLLKECIDENIELKKFRDKVITLLNKEGDKQ